MASSRQKSPAYDEPLHAVAGYSYWKLNDYRLHPENGNLPQRWLALPTALAGAEFPSLDQPAWSGSDGWRLGSQFLFECGNDLETLLWRGRGMAALLGAAVCLVVYLWSSSLFGARGGFLSLGLCALSPTMLAHGQLITSDMCAALFFTLGVWLIWRVLERLTLLRALASATAVAGLFLCKASAPLVLPMAAVMLVAQWISGRPWPLEIGRFQMTILGKRYYFGVLLAIVALHAVIVWGLIWLAYGLRYEAAADTTGPQEFFKCRTLDNACSLAGSSGKMIELLGRHRVLPEAWLYGTAYVLAHRQRDAFLNGEYSANGWPTFFPYCVLVKTPWPLFGLLLASALGIRRLRKLAIADRGTQRQLLYELVPLGSLLVIYWLTAIASSVNIGHRHMLPTYPAMFILAGAAAVWLDRTTRGALAIVALLLVGFVAESARAYPHYLAYFNPLVPRAQAHEHLVDSSLDWGQDLPGLKKWLDEHKLSGPDAPPVYLAYFGTGSPEHYGIRATWLPVDSARLEAARLSGGVYCISATDLRSVAALFPGRWNRLYERFFIETSQRLQEYRSQGPERMKALFEQRDQAFLRAIHDFESLRAARLMAYLRRRQPVDHVGYSILIYRLSDDQVQEAIAGPPVELDENPSFAPADEGIQPADAAP